LKGIQLNKLILRKADDMHVHLRQGHILEHILEQTIPQIARAVVMPNTVPNIDSVVALSDYRQNIEDSLKRINTRLGKHYAFEPLMTFVVGPKISTEMIGQFKAAGAIAGKLYPQGVTTNSEHGTRDFAALYPIYEAMEKEGLLLCIHGEDPEAFCLDREKSFLPIIKQIANDFPKLRIVFEHLTTAEAVRLVEDLPNNVAATLTLHHLLTTLDDVVGGSLKPHLFCKPLPKRSTDRDALIGAAMSGNPKFFLGSDSAPHMIKEKECDCGAAGVYTAPVLLPLLAQIFQEKDQLDKLEPFIALHGADFYHLPLNEERIELREEPWVVPKNIHGVEPFMSGHTLNWKVIDFAAN
jgi:dihydroorotase